MLRFATEKLRFQFKYAVVLARLAFKSVNLLLIYRLKWSGKKRLENMTVFQSVTIKTKISE